MGEELWYVKLANGDVHRVTLDQLDGAFQAGHIDETTMVLAAGESQWSKLGDLAGLGDEAEAPPPSYVAPAPAYVAPAAYAPRAVAAPAYVAPASYVPPAAHAAPMRTVPGAAYAPAASYPPAAYVGQHSHAAQTAVAVRTLNAPVPAALPNSLRPMSMDLDFDLDMPVRRGRKGRFVAAVIALAAVAGGVAFGAQRLHLGEGSDIASVAAAAAMAAPPAADPIADPAPPAAAALPAAVAPSAPSMPAATTPLAANAAPAEASPLNPQFTTRLNEDTTKKLLAADKTRGAKVKAHHSGGAARSSAPKSQTFTTGGNKFDPLNSSI